MEQAKANENLGVSLSRGMSFFEGAEAEGLYKAECFDKDGNLKWTEEFHNVVCTEGKNAALTALFKGSAFTQVAVMGLIGNVTYTAPVAGNTAANIATSASGNNWNESTSAVSSARKDLTTSNQFGTASAGSLSLTTAQSFSITGSDTINGVFILIKSVAGVAPTTTVANTSGAIWSAGAFSSAKAVTSGDTLSVSYTTSL